MTESRKLLIDACLHVSLAAIGREAGLWVDHVAYLGKGDWKDWNLTRYAVANGYVFVTNNRVDFVREYRRRGAHPGLIVIVPQLLIGQQQFVFREILSYIADRDMSGRTIEATIDSGVPFFKEFGASSSRQ